MYTVRGVNAEQHYLVEIEVVSSAGVSDKCIVGVFSNGYYYETVEDFENENASGDSSDAV